MKKRLAIWIVGLVLLLPLDLAAQTKVWRIGLFHVGLDHVPPSLEPLREGRSEERRVGKECRL